MVVRVGGSGALDPAWGDGGVARLGADAPLPTAVAAAPGGGVAVAGAKTVGTENAFWAASLDASGHPGFSTTTLLGTGDSSNGRDAHVRALAVQADGKLLVAGSARFEAPGMWQRRGTLVRYLPDGTLDPSFGTDGATIALRRGQRVLRREAAAGRPDRHGGHAGHDRHALRERRRAVRAADRYPDAGARPVR